LPGLNAYQGYYLQLYNSYEARTHSDVILGADITGIISINTAHRFAVNDQIIYTVAGRVMTDRISNLISRLKSRMAIQSLLNLNSPISKVLPYSMY